MVNDPDKPSRKEALSTGLKVYWRDRPCPQGHSGWFRVGGGCVECQRRVSRAYKEANKEDLRKKQIAYATSPSGVNVRQKYMDSAGRERASAWVRLKRNADPEFLAKSRLYCREYKERNAALLKQKRYEYLSRPEVISKTKETQDNWRKANSALIREARRKYYREYMANRRRNDPNYKALSRMRDFVRRCTEAARGKKNWRTAEILGYTPDTMRQHVESLWLDGMSWENYGEWHIDHVISINTYLKSGVDDISIINALNNLRPLWAFDNLSKGAR